MTVLALDARHLPGAVRAWKPSGPVLYGLIAGLIFGGWVLLPSVFMLFGVSLGSLSDQELLFYLPLREGLLLVFVLWVLITQRRARSLAERDLRAVGYAYPGALALVDQQGTIRFANTALLRLFHTDREAVQGRHVDDVFERILLAPPFSDLLPQRGKARLSVQFRPGFGDARRLLAVQIVADPMNGCWLVMAEPERPSRRARGEVPVLAEADLPS